MKSWRQRRLIASFAARKLSGKPPRTHSRSRCSSPTSVMSNGASSTNAILPARLSPDWASRSIASAFASTLIYHAAQCFEQPGRSVDLIEDDELLGMISEVQRRLGEAGPVRGGL
jgi:hypothetical protein